MRNDPQGIAIRTVPLTGFAGAEWYPALSPDGERVAFVWNGGKSGVFHDLYVQIIGAGHPLRLTESNLHEYSPAWSPDGREIAYLRETGIGATESEVLIIPALGGPSRRISTIGTADGPSGRWYPGLAWSPDGRFLGVVDQPSSTELPAIFLVSLENGEKRKLTFPTSPKGDVQPAFSPDGKSLAFIRWLGIKQGNVYLQSLSGGEPRLLTENEGFITDLDWTPDGSAIVFASGSESQAGTSLFRVPVVGGDPEPLPFGELAHTISIAREGARLAFDRRSWLDNDLWRVDGPASKERSSPTRLIASSRLEWGQEYSPDGTKVAFASERSGNNNVWICESDGTGCFQLTDMARAQSPYWSPDGKRIVFAGRDEGDRNHLYISEIEGGFTRRLTLDDSADNLPAWSRDGRWIYFTSDRSGEFQVWRIPAVGGTPTQITRKGGINPRESADGRFLFYADKFGLCNVRRVPVDGGKELPVMEPRVADAATWTLWSNQVVYATVEEGDPTYHLEVFDLDTRQVSRIFSTESGLYGQITVSPDGRWLLLSLGEPDASDIMLVEGFR